MITLKVGNMLSEVTTGFLVHGCNCRGAMGSGIAKSIRDKWPFVYSMYKQEHEEHGLKLGKILPIEISPSLVIVNAITQEFYKGHPGAPGVNRFVSYDAVEEAFRNMNELLPSIYLDVNQVLNFPLIGAGLANGNWDIIYSIIDNTVTNMDKVLWTLPE